MKKVYTLLLLVLLGAGTANAQLTLGLKGGLNFATLSSLPTGTDGDGSRIGLVFGAYTRIKVPVIGIFIQPELVIAQKGGKQTSGGISATTKITTLDIPIIIGKSFGPVRIGLGPVFGFPLSAKTDVAGVETDFKNITSSPLAGLQIGLGVSLPAGLGLDLRYELGLTKIVTVANSDTKTNAIQFTVSYKLF